MAMIDEAVLVLPDVSPEEISIDGVRAALAQYAWQWWYAHQEDVLVRRKILWITVAIRVRDLHGLFIKLFGDPA